MYIKSTIKLFSIFLVLITILTFTGCENNNGEEYSEYEVIVSREEVTISQNDNATNSQSVASDNKDNTSINTTTSSSEVHSSAHATTSKTESSRNSYTSSFFIEHAVSSTPSSKNENSSDKKPEENPNSNDPTEYYRKNWQLTFNDDFNGSSLDRNKWGYTPEWKRDTCYWKRDAVSVKDGNLILSVINTYEGYHAGAIRTIDTFKQAYGYFEVRCKAPTTSGINNSFWLMGGSMNNKVVEGGYDGAEIDIFETYDFKNKFYQNAIHWDGYGNDHRMDQQYVNKVNIYDGEFHTFGFAWTRNEYIFYVDGIETWRTTAGGVCQVPLYMKLTTCTGGWVGNPDPSKIPTEAMIVDYVRVYKDPNL